MPCLFSPSFLTTAYSLPHRQLQESSYDNCEQISTAAVFQPKDRSASQHVKVLGKGDGVTINGTKYVLSDTVVVGMCPDFGQPLFGRVVSFITGAEIVEFTCQVY